MLKNILTSLSGNKSAPFQPSEPSSLTTRLFQQLIKEVRVDEYAWYNDVPVADCPCYKEIKELNETRKTEMIWIAAITLNKVSKESPAFVSIQNYFREAERPLSAKVTEAVCKTLQKLLLREKWVMAEADFCKLVTYYNEHFEKGEWYSGHPANELVKKAGYMLEGKAPDTAMRMALQSLMVEESPYINNEIKKRNQKIQILLDGGTGLPVDKHDILGLAMLTYCENLPESRKLHWANLLTLCLSEGLKGAPSGKWLKEIKPLQQELKTELTDCMLTWLNLCQNRLREIHKQDGYTVNYLRDANVSILKGLFWCCPSEGSVFLQQAITDYVTLAYKKKTGVGPLSMATGTAGLWNLSQLPVKEGIPRLLAVRNRISNNTILKSIDKLLREAAEKNNLHPQEMEEIACPDFGMHEVGLWENDLGDYKLVIREIGYQAILTFEKNGKAVKSIPAAVKNDFSNELKTAKTLQKNISDQIRTHANRLENTFLHNRIWRFNNWKSLYIDHPLLGIIGRKVIWHFNTGNEKFEAIYHNGKLALNNGGTIDTIPDEAEVSLWHPIGFDSAYIVQWRQWMRDYQIQQPFKQAFREVYILTDAELRTDTYSNRYAAHIIKQHQFNALAKIRGWSYQLMGAWDSHNHPIRNLPWLNMYVEWFVDANWEGETSGSGIYNYIMTDQVRFYRNGVLLPLYDVPALVFSELMRDIDMFVGVCSIGNDPNWQDSGNTAANTYWHNYSFSAELSASAEVRKETLQHLIPRMKIANVCRFDKRFLIVQGKLRTYKIHLGSGNILMEPNDQYLCIVPDSKPSTAEKNIFIPFEGDRMLSIIISKALLLADDDKITDITITRQIV